MLKILTEPYTESNKMTDLEITAELKKVLDATTELDAIIVTIGKLYDIDVDFLQYIVGGIDRKIFCRDLEGAKALYKELEIKLGLDVADASFIG